ncbi:HlyD family secretion protein [Chloroflexota bacterium]
MKIRGAISLLLVGLILITASACGSDEKETTDQQQSEGDTIVTVSADGNIEASLNTKLTFSSGGKVEAIYVKEGDKVSKDDILAKLDTSILELSVTRAEVAQTEAKIAVDKAEAGIIQAQVGMSQAQATLANAKIALELSRAIFSVSDIKIAETGVNLAQSHLDETLWTFLKYDPGTPSYDMYQEVVLQAEARLKAAEDTLDSMLAGYDVQEVASKRLQVEAAEQSVELAEQTLTIAEDSLILAEQSLELVRQSLEMAQIQLDEATIIAPFDGTVYKVGVKEGEFLSPATFSGTTIIGIVDLSHMELVASIDELDIAKIEIGQKVIISLDALPEVKLEGQITFISPVDSEPDGILLFESNDEVKKYDIKVDFNVTEGLGIRSGMSSTFNIIVE